MVVNYGGRGLWSSPQAPRLEAVAAFGFRVAAAFALCAATELSQFAAGFVGSLQGHFSFPARAAQARRCSQVAVLGRSEADLSIGSRAACHLSQAFATMPQQQSCFLALSLHAS